MTSRDQRIMRIPLPIELIRQMDALILQGVGGYATRAEFIVDAIQERVLEITVPAEVSDLLPVVASRSLSASAAGSTSRGSQYNTRSTDTSLQPKQLGYIVPDHENLGIPEGRPLFGLHNRDFPSLWALDRLAEAAANGPVRIEDFYETAISEAWAFGRRLRELEALSGGKHSALFPTNHEKKKAAESAFRMFAIGDYRQSQQGEVRTSGPLFEWDAAGIVVAGRGLSIGVTQEGWRLLDGCVGISVDEPHPAHLTRAFGDYLKRNAEPDWRCLLLALSAVGMEGASRQEVLDSFRSSWPDWSGNEVSTNAAGYVARAREWGLIEPKQLDGRYNLTTLGNEYLAQHQEGTRL